MVGLQQTSQNAPVEVAHVAIHQTGATITTTLSNLSPPPLSEIPFIDSPTAITGTWVQCLAMVQDIWDAELFISSSPSGATGLLVENAACSDDPRAKLAERLPVYLVSLPGETAWAREARRPALPAASLSSSNGTKRARDEDENMDLSSDSPIPTPPQLVAGSEQQLVGSVPTQGKRSRGDDADACPTPAANLGLNLPIPGQQGSFAVVAKVYDGVTGRALRINTLMHVVGILQDAIPVAGEGEFAEELRARNPSIVQRLHVVRMREVTEREMNPATARLGNQVGSAREELLGVLSGLREVCLKYFASALGGDLLAAEYVLMGILSRPVIRTGGGVMGKLCVNLIVPEDMKEMVEEIVGALERVCAAVVRVGINIAALNAGELYPKKDYELNRVKAGVLQLTEGCVMVGDETQMSDGRLSERGLKNVKAIGKVIAAGVTPIDFQYYEAEAPVGCCAILVSKGGKSIVGGDVAVKIVPELNGLVRWESCEEGVLDKLRTMLGLLMEDGEFDIEEEASKEVEENYVKARREGRAKDGQEALQGWLAVARSCARSFGERKLTRERWICARELEEKRCARMKA